MQIGFSCFLISPRPNPFLIVPLLDSLNLISAGSAMSEWPLTLRS
ncbi:hypothetical protein LOK49_Contig449G00001 [Camellia lanceoleosa]|nr:hypothetical protein LOK49_Contig449G00001 [Camellia lanceoleosa]